MIRMANLQAQTQEISASLYPRLNELIERSSFIGGPEIAEFEKEFGDYVGSPECIGVGNGTDAIEIALTALGIGAGDEVIVPAFSYAATSEAVLSVGATPMFADVATDLLIDIEQVSQLISVRTKAIIPVHLYGNPVDIESLNSLVDSSRITILEDAAQGHGASSHGVQVGNLGVAAAFSFYPGKNLGAWGDAGGITTSDGQLATRIRRISNHGRLGKFDHEIAGRNSRLDSIQAVVLSEKLKQLDSWIDKRNSHAQIYLRELQGIDWLKLPSEPISGRHAWHLFVIRVPDRDDFRQYMRDLGVETGIHYPYALPDLPFHDSTHNRLGFPEARSAAKSVVSIPVSEHLTDSDLNQVVSAVQNYRW